MSRYCAIPFCIGTNVKGQNTLPQLALTER